MDDLQEAGVQIITGLICHFVDKVVDYIKSLPSDEQFCLDQEEIKKQLNKYLRKSSEHFNKTKTLLYKNEPREFYSFFVSPNIDQGNNRKEISTISSKNVYSLGNHLLITGIGGMGKSMLMRHLFLDTIRNEEMIPVFIELRSFNECGGNVDIAKAVYSAMHQYGFDYPYEELEKTFASGQYVFLFDGFDELKQDVAAVVEPKLLEFSRLYANNIFVVSSRPNENLFVSWSEFLELKAKPLNNKQAIELITKLDYDENIKKKFIEELNKKLFSKYESFASNPLLLTIMLMTFSTGGEIPKNTSEFYEQAFSALFKEHDASKGVYIREKHCGLEYFDFKRILAHVCLKSFLASDYSFTKDKILKYIDDAKKKCGLSVSFTAESFLKDLTDTVCMLVKDGTKYIFIHRSFQEYFAAYYTSLLSDDDQKRLFELLNDNHDWIGFKAYLYFLKSIEPNRYYSSLIYPHFAPIIKKSLGKDYILKLILSIYSGIRIRDDDYGYALYISDPKTCVLFHSLDGETKQFVKRQQYLDKAKELFKLKSTNKRPAVDIDDIYRLPGGKEFLENFFSDVLDRYAFLSKKIEEEEKRKTNTSSFIDEI